MVERLVSTLWLRCSSVLLALLLTSVVYGQSDAGAGALRGTVSSADGKPAADAAVVVRNAETGYTRELQSDELGQFSALALAVGTYLVQARKYTLNPGDVSALVT